MLLYGMSEPEIVTSDFDREKAIENFKDELNALMEKHCVEYNRDFLSFVITHDDETKSEVDL